MSELHSSGMPRKRGRRADAQRSVAAILDAVAAVLAVNPRASMADIAARAGLTRQTVYAHFSSREALVDALIDRATDQILRTLDAADLDSLPACDALVRLVQISWDQFETASFLLAVPPAHDAERDRERHQPVLVHLTRIIERGQRDGDFDASLPSEWIVAATVALGHAAGDQVRVGTMTTTQARATLAHALPLLFTRPDPSTAAT